MTGIALRDCGCGCASCNGDSICPCEDVHGPWRIANPSGLTTIAYRVGDFASFRHELVRHLEGEQQLAIWRPTAGDDLALQIVDWFAIVADILTFYSERIANEAYLGTALLPGQRAAPRRPARVPAAAGDRRGGDAGGDRLGTRPDRDPRPVRDRFEGAAGDRLTDVRADDRHDLRLADERPQPALRRSRHGPHAGRAACRLAAGSRRAAAARPADRPRWGARQGQGVRRHGGRPAAPDQAVVDGPGRPRRRRLRDRAGDGDRPAREAQHAGAAGGHRRDPGGRQGGRLRAQALDAHEPSRHRSERRRLDQGRSDRARLDRAVPARRRSPARRGARERAPARTTARGSASCS